MAINIGDALSYPSKDESWVTKFVIGGVLGVFSFLLLPYFAMTGYSLEVTRKTMEGDDRNLPDWSTFMDYAMRGFFVGLIYLVYMLIPGILCIVGFFGTIASLVGGASNDSVAVAAGGGGVSMIIGFAGIALAALFSALLPMATLRYARTLQIGEAFNIGGVTSDIMKAPVDYLICWLVPMAVLTVLNGGLSMIPVVGWLLVPLGMFYCQVLSGQLLGQYHRAHLERL